MNESFKDACCAIASELCDSCDWSGIKRQINRLDYPYHYSYVAENIRKALRHVDALDKQRPKNPEHDLSELRYFLEQRIPGAYRMCQKGDTENEGE